MRKYFQAPWSIKDVIITLLVIVALLGIALLGLWYFDVKELVEGSEHTSLYLLLLFLVQWVLIIIPLLVITGIKYKFSWKGFGMTKIGVYKVFKLVLGGYLLFLGISLIISLIILYTGLKIPGYQVQERILPLFSDNTLTLVLSGFIIVVIAPFLEELFFRGFLLRTLSNKTGIVYGSILTAAIFALLHLQLGSVIPIFILGLIINSLVIKGKSIVPAIAFHMFNNAVAFTLEVLILKDVVKFEELV